MRNIHTDKQAGFSLIEMAIAIVVMGFLAAAGFVLLGIYSDVKVRTTTQSSMSSIELALQEYRKLNGKYPCPAPLTAAPDTAAYGKAADTNCASGTPVAGETFRATGREGRTIRYGAIPFKDLNLPEEESYDGNRRRILYGITEYYASGTPDFYIDNGAITVVDSEGQNATDVAGNVIYAFMSAGKDKHGAYTYEGKQILPCDTAAQGGENCDFDETLRASLYKQDEGLAPFTHTLLYLASTTGFEWKTGPWSECMCKEIQYDSEGKPLYGPIDDDGKPLFGLTDTGNVAWGPNGEKRAHLLSWPLLGYKKGTAPELGYIYGPSKIQKRAVFCVDKKDKNQKRVEDKFCAAMPKPAETQPCIGGCWDAKPFPLCVCGYATATYTRIVKCMDKDTMEQQAEEICPPPKPAESKTCRYYPCPPPPPPDPPRTESRREYTCGGEGDERRDCTESEIKRWQYLNNQEFGCGLAGQPACGPDASKALGYGPSGRPSPPEIPPPPDKVEYHFHHDTITTSRDVVDKQYEQGTLKPTGNEYRAQEYGPGGQMTQDDATGPRTDINGIYHHID